MSVSALILSAVVTALTTWDSFADYHWKWVRYRATLYNLYTIRDDLRYQLSGDGINTTTQVDDFYNRIKAALKETDEQWVSQRMKAAGAGTAQAAQGQTGGQK